MPEIRASQPADARARRAARGQLRHAGLDRGHHQGGDGAHPPAPARRGPARAARAPGARRAAARGARPRGLVGARARARRDVRRVRARPAARGRRRRRRRLERGEGRSEGADGALANGLARAVPADEGGHASRVPSRHACKSGLLSRLGRGRDCGPRGARPGDVNREDSRDRSSCASWPGMRVRAAGGGVAPASAAPTELFFSEYIEGSSNNKAVEIYNGTGAPIDLAAGGYSRGDVLQRRHDRRSARSSSPAPSPQATSYVVAQATASPAHPRAGRPDERRRLVQRRRRGRAAQGRRPTST